MTSGAVFAQPLSSLLDRRYKPREPAIGDEVWNLNLDQIEPHTGRILSKCILNVSELGPSTSAFARGTVLYSKLRPYLNKVVVADDDGVATTELVLIRCDETRLNADYLAHFLRGPEFLRFATNVVAGAKMPRMVMSEFWKFPVPLPPLPEQRRIAAILDQSDALRAKRREALAQLDSLTQSIFIEMFGDPVVNRLGFAVASLTDVCHCYSGGTPSKANPDFWAGSVPWFSAKDMKANDLFDSQDHIHESVTRTTSLKLLPPDTTAIVVRGMILAHTFPVCVLRVAATINQDLKALIPRKDIDTQFLASCLRSQSKAVLEKVSEAGHGTKRLDSEGLGQIKVLLPAAALQQTFATRIQAVESLKTTQRTALAELDALFASLQHRAFAGQLS